MLLATMFVSYEGGACAPRGAIGPPPPRGVWHLEWAGSCIHINHITTRPRAPRTCPDRGETTGGGGSTRSLGVPVDVYLVGGADPDHPVTIQLPLYEEHIPPSTPMHDALLAMVWRLARTHADGGCGEIRCNVPGISYTAVHPAHGPTHGTAKSCLV